MQISLRLSKFLLELLGYNTSLIWNLVPLSIIMFALSEPSTKFAVPDMVLTLLMSNLESIF